MYIVIIVFVLVIMFFILRFVFKKPNGTGDWSRDQAVLSYADIDGENITIHNMRSIQYRSTTDYTVNYFDKKINLKDVQTVDFIVEPFEGKKGIAHTLVSFGLKDGNYIAISIEVRKQKGEHFSAWKGLFKHFELMYVIADERDVIMLRSNFRRDNVYLYRIKTTPERAQKMFLSMIEKTNKLKKKPEFYNTLTSTCTSNLAKHTNIVVPNRIPISMKIMIPTLSDKLAYDIGLIENSTPFEEVKGRALINERAIGAQNDPEFSKRIREQL